MVGLNNTIVLRKGGQKAGKLDRWSGNVAEEDDDEPMIDDTCIMYHLLRTLFAVETNLSTNVPDR